VSSSCMDFDSKMYYAYCSVIFALLLGRPVSAFASFLSGLLPWAPAYRRELHCILSVIVTRVLDGLRGLVP
jgi:hypothetical protein